MGGTDEVLYVLTKAIKWVVIPIALEPFHEGAIALSQVQLVRRLTRKGFILRILVVDW